MPVVSPCEHHFLYDIHTNSSRDNIMWAVMFFICLFQRALIDKLSELKNGKTQRKPTVTIYYNKNWRKKDGEKKRAEYWITHRRRHTDTHTHVLAHAHTSESEQNHIVFYPIRHSNQFLSLPLSFCFDIKAYLPVRRLSCKHRLSYYTHRIHSPHVFLLYIHCNAHCSASKSGCDSKYTTESPTNTFAIS